MHLPELIHCLATPPPPLTYLHIYLHQARLRGRYVKKAVEHVLQTEFVSETEARRIALERYRKVGIIRTYGPQPRELRASWETLIDRFKNDRSLHGKNSIIRHLRTSHTTATLRYA